MYDNSTSTTVVNTEATFVNSTVTMAFDVSTRDLMMEARDAASWDDATWILTSAFIIFTMQSGFGLLESGSVSAKNEVNIMAKNVADVIFGGISYWMLGYGFSFGDGTGTNGFCGFGKFFIDPDDSVMGEEFSRFVFQSSFATTATTIVSGAIAERTKYLAYIIFSFFNTFVFCFPAHWVWSKHGWLNKMGVVDVAGDGPVHVVGGATSLVATLMIKPRAKRFTPQDDHQMGSPTGALLGLFILWWGWLAFNCGSTYGISGGKWKMAARAAATTLMSSSSGGVVGFAFSYIVNKKKFYIPQIINGVLAGLVSITASCAVTGIWESLVIGSVGGTLVMLADALLVKLHIDDPVSAIPVHGVGGVWGLLAAGLFTHKDTITQRFSRRHGLVRGGGLYLFGVQVLAIVVIAVWSMFSAGIILKILDVTMGLRMSLEEEEIGADFVEHNIRIQPARYRPDVLSSVTLEKLGRTIITRDMGDILSNQGSTPNREPIKHENIASSPATEPIKHENIVTNGNGSATHSICETNKGKQRNVKSKSKLRFLSLRNRLRKHSQKEIARELALRDMHGKKSASNSLSVPGCASKDDLTAVNSDLES